MGADARAAADAAQSAGAAGDHAGGILERGRQFAARWAEVIFTLQHSKPDMQAFYADIKTRMERCGRAPEECIITPAIDIVLGRRN